jgi:hypothetical protein
MPTKGLELKSLLLTNTKCQVLTVPATNVTSLPGNLWSTAAGV